MLSKRYYLPIFCAALLCQVAYLSLGGDYRIGFLVAVFAFIVNWRLGLLISLGFVLAIGSYSHHEKLRFENYHELPAKKITTAAYVQQQEIRPGLRQRLQLLMEDGELKGKKVLATLSRYPSYEQGSNLLISCNFVPPEPFDGFAYDKYLASQKIFALCEDPWVEEQLPTEARGVLEKIRIAIKQRIAALWPKPARSLIAGLLLGSREDFPEQTWEDFSRSGVTHIVALSGFNITIIVVFLEAFFIRVYVPKKIRIALIIGSIIFFTIFVGGRASILRAAVLGCLVLSADWVARPKSTGRLLIFSAAMMVLFEPYILMHDVGFQLSFLATIGLVYFQPFVDKFLFWLPNFLAIRESFSTTLAAHFFTLPLILFQFEKLSVVAPFSNVLILPLIPWEMAAAALATVTTANFLVIPTQLGAQYILQVASKSASFVWSAYTISLPLWGMILSYICLILIIFYEKRFNS